MPLNWFKDVGKIYDKGQPYVTFAKTEVGRESIEKGLKSLVSGEKLGVAVEVGPGVNPFLNKVEADRKVFVDVSKTLLDKLRVGRQFDFFSKTFFVQGKVQSVKGLPESLPVKKSDLIIMNEVLSHVHPDAREGVLRDLAGKSNKILITDMFEDRGLGVNPEQISDVLTREGFSVKQSKHMVRVRAKSKSGGLESEVLNYFIIQAKK
jgi:hypothetical protein